MSEFDLSKIMQQAQMLQDKMKYMQEGLETEKVEGTAGAGMVKATVTGTQKLVAVHIDPSVLSEDAEMIQDLVVAAVNNALEKSRELAQSRMGSLVPPGMMPPGFPGL